MKKICEVSNPEIVLKQLKKYYGDDVDLYLSSSKYKKYMVFDEQGKKVHFGSILYQDYTKHKNKNEEIILGIEIKDGKMLINLLLLIYRIICCGNQNMGFASSINLFSGLSLYERTIIFPPRFTCRNPLPYFLSPYTLLPSKMSGLCCFKGFKLTPSIV